MTSQSFVGAGPYMRENWIRVAIVEDYENLRVALAMQLNLCRSEPGAPRIECVATFETFEKAAAGIPKLNEDGKAPDVVLLDLGLPGMGGIEGTAVIKRKWPLMKVVIYTVHEEEEKIIAAIANGADGYVFKSKNRHEIATAIQDAHESKYPMATKVMRVLVAQVTLQRLLWPALSPKERQILEACKTGRRRQKEIASDLNMSVHTLKSHLNRIRTKYNAGNIREAGSKVLAA